MNTTSPYKASRRWTWHHADGEHHSQIDYIMVPRCFQSCLSTAKTRSFPGADAGSDHDLVMMAFHLHLKVKKQGHTRIKFNLEKLMDPGVAQGFQAMIGSRFAPLTIFDTDMNILINTFNPAATKSASEILDKQKP